MKNFQFGLALVTVCVGLWAVPWIIGSLFALNGYPGLGVFAAVASVYGLQALLVAVIIRLMKRRVEK